MSIPFLVVPRPQSSFLYTVPEARPELFLAEGDLLVVERDRGMRTGRLMLISTNGAYRLAEIRRERGRLTVDGMPEDAFDSDVEAIGVVTRVIRMLETTTGAAGSDPRPRLRGRGGSRDTFG